MACNTSSGIRREGITREVASVGSFVFLWVRSKSFSQADLAGPTLAAAVNFSPWGGAATSRWESLGRSGIGDRRSGVQGIEVASLVLNKPEGVGRILAVRKKTPNQNVLISEKSFNLLEAA